MKYKFLASLALFLMCNFLRAEEKILNVYAWSGYLTDSVIQKFEEETGIHINHSTYSNNEVLYAKLKASQDAGYDIVMPSSYFVSRMVKQGLLQKLDKTKLKNMRNVDPTFLGKEYDPHNTYSIPYLWSATGVAVNNKFHDPALITSWKNLWDNRFLNQLLVLDDTREDFSIALITLGYSVNDTNPQHIHEAFEKLKKLMKNIKLFNTDAQRSIYLDEDITIGMGWNGDIFLAKQENPSLEFIYPKEGFVITLDNIAIPKDAKHVENAHRFINFILRPEIAKEISLTTGFSTANQAAHDLMPKEIKTDPILYPSAAVMRKGYFQTDVGTVAPLYEKYFERLKLEE